MPKYFCDGFRAVDAESNADAAGIFADRLARKHYGRRGDVRTLRKDSWTQDSSRITYQAFVGRTNRQGVTAGHNVFLTVVRE